MSLKKISCISKEARDQLSLSIPGSWTGYSVNVDGYRWFVYVYTYEAR